MKCQDCNKTLQLDRHRRETVSGNFRQGVKGYKTKRTVPGIASMIVNPWSQPLDLVI